MPNCRKNILYTPDLAKMPCLARTHCNTCTSYTKNGAQNVFNKNDCPADEFGIKGQLLGDTIDYGKIVDGNDNFIINLDCCDNTCNTCNTHDCCCVDPVRPKKCCANPCIDGALPLLTKCGLKQKKQLQHGITLVNPCTKVYPNPCPASRNPIRPVKPYNKKYSFNDQLLLLKSNAFNKSVYNCNQFVKGVGCRNRNGGIGSIICPTNSCFKDNRN